MGGYGSGRQGGRATVESALRLDIDAMMRTGAIESGAYVGSEMTFRLDDDELAIEFESSAGDPGHSWLRLRYAKAVMVAGNKADGRRLRARCGSTSMR